MLTDAVLTAGFFAIMSKVPLAAWTAVFLFRWTDRRVSSLAWPLLLSLLAGGFSLWAYFEGYERSATSWLQLSRAGFSILAFLSGFQVLAAWLRRDPRQVHREIAATSGSGRDAKKKRRRLEQSAGLAGREWLLLFVGLLVSALGLCLQESMAFDRMDAAEWQPSHSSAAMMTLAQALSSCGMLGVSVFCAAQITFLSSPDSLGSSEDTSDDKQVKWNIVDYFSMVVLAVALVLALRVFTSDRSMVGEELLTRLLPIVFAVALILLHFVAWMVPHRVHGFQRAGEAKEWTSLALAAWVCVLSFTLLCALPASWPWVP